MRYSEDVLAQSSPRKILFVIGAGRSGTSTLASLFRILGLHVPEPEIPANITNPKGFAEPTWVVNTHDRLLRSANVQLNDSRPSAWVDTRRVGASLRERASVAQWLEPQFSASNEIVIKDPRLAWFLELWQHAASQVSATPLYATMLRHPAEVVSSKEKYYAVGLGAGHLAASWVNTMLQVEHATRGGNPEFPNRLFVRYDRLLEDPREVLKRTAEVLSVREALDASETQWREAVHFVEPRLRRVTVEFEDLSLPPRLRDLVLECWAALTQLGDPRNDRADLHRTFDELRGTYVDLYSEAEAISKSSVVAAEDALRNRPASVLAGEMLRAAVPLPIKRRVRTALDRFDG